MPAPRDQTAGAESAGSVKSIGERVRGLTRGIEAQSVGRRVMAVPRSSRKSARPSMVVTASSKKAKKGEARAATDGVRLGGEEDDLSSFGSPLNLNDRLERGSTVSRTQEDQLRHGRPFLPPARAARDEEIEDDDDENVDEENAVAEEPGFDSCDEGAGGEAFDSFESVSQAAVLDGVDDADRFGDVR